MICRQGHITKDVPVIFDAVFECTLDMINKVVVLLLLLHQLLLFYISVSAEYWNVDQ